MSRAVENDIEVHIAVVTIKGEWHVRNGIYVSSETRKKNLQTPCSKPGDSSYHK